MAQLHWACEYINVEIYANIENCCRLPKFRFDGMQKVHEACQMGKRARHALP